MEALTMALTIAIASVTILLPAILAVYQLDRYTRAMVERKWWTINTKQAQAPLMRYRLATILFPFLGIIWWRKANSI